MRLNMVRTIAVKELREALRDRRTLFIMVGIPILMYPLMLIGMSKLEESQEAAQKARVSRVAVWGDSTSTLLERLARNKDKLEPLVWEGVPADIREKLTKGLVKAPPPLPLALDDIDPEKRPKPNLEDPVVKAAQGVILNRQADAVLVLWPQFSANVQSGAAGTASIFYDSVRPESHKARDRVSDELRQWREDVRTSREQNQKLATGFILGVDIQTQDIAPPKRKSGMILGMILPYMLISFSVLGGFYAAIDMTAGEKERGTMQTLLCAPLESLEIITGKFLAVWGITIITTVINLISLATTFARIRFIPGMQMSISMSSLLLTFLLLLPITFMVTAVFLAVGAFAKDFKEGQSYLMPVFMVLIIPIFFTMSPGIELNRYLAFVPVVNISLLIRQIFLSEWKPDLLFLALLSAFCYASLTLVFAARVFERNNLLLGGKENIHGILDFSRRPGAKPTPGLSIFLFAASLVLLFYGSLALENRGIVALLLVTEFIFILGPALALSSSKGFNLAETFSLHRPGWRGMAAGLCIGVSAWTIAAGVLVRLLPPPESLIKALEKILLLEKDSAPIWQVVLLVAVGPALCEEMFFRGFIQSGFRRLGMWPAIVATGFLFGLMHSSIYRLMPTFFLGVMFGYAVWRTRSVLVGILCHALNNGLMIGLARSHDLAHKLGLGGAQFVPWHIVVAGALVLVVGLWLLRYENPVPAVSASRAA